MSKVLFVHGAGGGAWEYMFWEPAFKEAGYQVHNIDLMPSSDGGYEATTFKDYLDQLLLQSRVDVIVGASMGGMLALKASETIKPKAVILVCTSLPAGFTQPKASPFDKVVRWSKSTYESTRNALKDASEATRTMVWEKWRDESGTVLKEIQDGISVSHPGCPVLCIIPGRDGTVDPDLQQQLADSLGADSFRFAEMSHVGPLLSTRGKEVAKAVILWLKHKSI